ncbi:CPBP family intramembrane glutamic endopeptidase [Thermodesulfobacteriota bacterium]
MRKEEVPILKAMGFSFDHQPLLNLLIGAVIGSCAISGIFFFELWFEMLTITGINSASALIKDLSTYIIVPLIEETLFRCAFLGGLLLILKNRLVAIVISAVVFGGLHSFNSNATVLSVFSTMLGGLAYALAFVSTERIYLPFGLHLGWNYTQARVFGFHISGSAVRGPAPFVQQHDLGPVIVTGGTYGPEGGFLGLCGRIMVLLLIASWLIIQQRRKHIIESEDT